MSSEVSTPVDQSEAGAVTEYSPEALTANEPVKQTDKSEQTKTSRYRILWRWHFYAGVFIAPVLFASSLTGGIYVFHEELSRWLYADTMFVEPEGEPLSYDEQWKIAEKEFDGVEMEGLLPNPDPRRSTVFAAHLHEGGDANAAQQHYLVTMNPYTGEILSKGIQEHEFFHVVLAIHRNLFAGMTGRVIVELGTSWGLIMMATGLYLWWPRKGRANRGVWFPKLNAKPYAVLRDFHAIAGAYVAIFAIIIFSTGMFFSLVWGTAYQILGAQVGQSIMPIFTPKDAPAPTPDAPKASWDTVVNNLFEGAEATGEDFILLPESKEEGKAHKAFVLRNMDHFHMRVVDINQYTGEVIAVTKATDLPPMAFAFPLAISLHQGKTFGLPSKIIALISCLFLMGSVVTGYWMWWKRRPKGSLGFPARPVPWSTPLWLWGVVAIVGLLLPVAGVSMLLILGVDALVIQWQKRRSRLASD
ncbi:PepSY-associated TM helix domain-containing protein [Calycomorphotria hydatis]|uniref:PepSY-associated TM helix n=1 Tax=Calycomorphotria hydatis TaxID=2528027 RepID=A0A517T7M9_9PLAN|nr:PepSY domain-containing protein [Calycomorphotria hydatis]QDT64381.1 hypothetical protein V22_16150 [Calycomorphotria hydatis]